MGATGWIFTVLISVLTAAVLELNKNTLAGWALFFTVLAVQIVLAAKYMGRFSRWKKALCVLVYLVLCVGIIFISWPPVKRMPAADTNDFERTNIYHTEYGDVNGVILESGVELFAGIPYAAPPVGELRWKKPQDPAPWEGVLECDTFAPMSMQKRNLPIYDSLARIIGYHDYKISLNDSWREAASEDSLYINIWRPAGELDNAPVAVYIHGGSLQTGQPSYGDYSGESFAENGIIVVNMGYRLGVFGFLATEEILEEEGTAGNFGLLDQIKALEWVRDNIAYFGGDPGNVTIIGESAGAVCVDALCVSPLADGLFRRAIMESSTASSKTPPHSFRSFDVAVASGADLMERYGCTSLEELREIPAEKLAAEQSTQHHLTVDGYALTDTPYNLRMQGIHNEEAVIHGYNAEESASFIIFSPANMKNYETKVRAWAGDYADEVLALYSPSTDEEANRYWAKIYGAIFFNYPHFCLNRLEQANGVPSWEYYFTKTNGRLGCWHSGELIYCFARIPDDSALFTSEDRILSDIVHSYWINFIKYGDPNGEGLPEFSQSADSSSVLELGDNTGMIDTPDIELNKLMDIMYEW